MGATKRLCEMIVQDMATHGSIQIRCGSFRECIGVTWFVIPHKAELLKGIITFSPGYRTLLYGDSGYN